MGELCNRSYANLKKRRIRVTIHKMTICERKFYTWSYMMISHMRGLFLSHNLQEFSLLETVFFHIGLHLANASVTCIQPTSECVLNIVSLSYFVAPILWIARHYLKLISSMIQRMADTMLLSRMTFICPCYDWFLMTIYELRLPWQ